MTTQNHSSDEQSVHELVIVRVFDAPREKVFRACTETERLAQWWGPQGFAVEVVKHDLCPGGIFHYSMRAANGFSMWGRFTYQEIAAPERLVFCNGFSDETGNLARAPFSAEWPLEVFNTWTFTEQDGKTTLTLRGHPVNPTAEEQATFQAGLDAMRMGFDSTLDQLADYLAKN